MSKRKLQQDINGIVVVKMNSCICLLSHIRDQIVGAIAYVSIPRPPSIQLPSSRPFKISCEILSLQQVLGLHKCLLPVGLVQKAPPP